ncbi:MAG: type II secretion system F family protein [Patescibacteria group bacterium]|jgi:type IV pilus assembly protein PilC
MAPKGEKKPKEQSALEIWLTDHLTRIPIMQKILFVHNLSIMVKAGLSIVDGLRILAEQVENKRLKKVISLVKAQVEKGRQLSEALADYPQVFPAIYVSMIGAGEAAGKMEESLTQVSSQMKKSYELTSHIKGALIYPAVVLVAMAGVGIGMVTFVLPKILGMFTEMDVELPLTTRMLIFVVNAFQNYGIFMLIGFIALIVLGVWLMKKPKVKDVVHNLMLKLPIFGPVIKKVNIARFTLTLSSLLQSAIPIIEAVKITSAVEGNVKYRDDLIAVSEALKKGEPLSEALGRSPSRFPPMVVQMIMVGEQSGEVEAMLKELANYYSEEVDNTMRNFSTIIEPVLILILGVGVAGIAVSVIMPIYSLSSSM